MPQSEKQPRLLNLKFLVQLIAGLIFVGLGIFIFLTTFENNYVLIGPKKQFFGGILCLYGLVRLIRIYFAWRTQKQYYYEDKNF